MKVNDYKVCIKYITISQCLGVAEAYVTLVVHLCLKCCKQKNNLQHLHTLNAKNLSKVVFFFKRLVKNHRSIPGST